MKAKEGGKHTREKVIMPLKDRRGCEQRYYFSSLELHTWCHGVGGGVRERKEERGVGKRKEGGGG